MNQAETPVWVKYVGDLIFLIAFLVVLLFFKPSPEPEEFDENEEEPNPLEKMLVSDDDSVDDQAETHDSQDQKAE
ncbi:MAG: hypothetical protein ACOYXC_07755 [Candidatus Rifleibacteriota bacterium]